MKALETYVSKKNTQYPSLQGLERMYQNNIFQQYIKSQFEADNGKNYIQIATGACLGKKTKSVWALKSVFLLKGKLFSQLETFTENDLAKAFGQRDSTIYNMIVESWANMLLYCWHFERTADKDILAWINIEAQKKYRCDKCHKIYLHLKKTGTQYYCSNCLKEEEEMLEKGKTVKRKIDAPPPGVKIHYE